MMKLIQRARNLAILISIFLVSAALQADTLRLNVGIWPGELDPEMEGRLRLDDLVDTTPRYDLAWANKDTTTIYPLGLQYFKPIGKGKLVISGNYIRYAPEYNYTGITSTASISLVTLEDFATTDWELEAGYEIPLLGNKLFLTPRLGFRWHTQEFNYNELTLGSTVAISLDSPFSGNARGSYAALETRIYVLPQVALVFDFMTTSIFPNFGGSMEFEQTVLETPSTLKYDRATASYEVEFSRYSVGVQYDVDPKVHLQLGVREETQKTSYPGYYNLAIRTSGINNTVNEIISDIVFWDYTKQTQTKGFAFFSFGYDIDI
ncbi:MAG: hypothetical protein KDK37_09850 [Leptospiraceae bacterium]|nr:hypothetical protein [Leptospiraceae bacterium]MCB1304572.1 hypothetical protein [Leptospiraceae bacterium]